MSNYKELIHGFDDLAASLGPTPVFNEMGEIVPIGQPEGGRRMTIYVVWVGRAIGLFHNWGIASAMVTGFSGASHKVFPSLASARRAWLQGPTAGAGEWHPPRPRPAIPTYDAPPSEPSSRASQTNPDREGVEWQLNLSRDVAIPDIGDGSCSEIGNNSHDDKHKDESDNELYWRHYDDRLGQEDERGHDSLLSPTISSVSSLSLSSSPGLTAGTISPTPIETPALHAVALSPPSTPRIISRALPTPATAVASRASPSAGLTSRAQTSSPSRPPLHSSDSPQRSARIHGSGRHPSSQTGQRNTNASTTGSKVRIPAVEVVAVPRPKEFFVVIRGEHPGIYMDRNTALLMLGTRPGMKLVVFKSLSRAAWYFVQQYMARKVGVPVMTSEGSLAA